MDVTTIIEGFEFNRKLAHKLCEDVAVEDFTHSPGIGLENHPAWTIGHLVTAAALTAEYLGGLYEIPEGWEQIFRRTGPGDPRRPDEKLDKYPSRQMLLDEYDRQHLRVVDQLNLVTDHFLMEEKKWRYATHMPNRLGVVTFMCLMHEAMHLSQLSAWRRAMNYDSALAKV